MSNRSIQLLWGIRVRALSRIWICCQCGAKVYCGRLTAQPAYRCLCGQVDWRRPGDTPWVGKSF